MSTKPGGATAQVFDLRPSHLTRIVSRASLERETQPGSVLDDFSDIVEAIHAVANLANFSERARSLIFALASFTRARSGDYVELFDEELAQMQNCSTKTVQRQRADYLREARALKFNLIEIIEGEIVGSPAVEGNAGAYRHSPTRYRFILGETVERVVTDARQVDGWDGLDRKRQREIIQRAAARVYEEIPDAPPRRRKRKRERAAAEVMTCQKVISKQLEKLRDRARKLPRTERERLLEEPGDLRAWWLEVRAEMDAFCNADSPQVDDPTKLGQLVHHPSDEEQSEAELSPEDDALWEGLKKRVSASPIQSVEIALRAPEPVPRAPGDETDDDLTVEESEAEAVRAEACGERAPWEKEVGDE